VGCCNCYNRVAYAELKRLTKHFGEFAAVSQLDMYVNRGEIVGLIGPDGAGKTTVVNLISGVYSPTKGQVIYEGTEIAGKKPHKVAELGIRRW
jgi:branched-chain amino acid transport system ATP-binding protein